jgi:hypothetical protein
MKAYSIGLRQKIIDTYEAEVILAQQQLAILNCHCKSQIYRFYFSGNLYRSTIFLANSGT